MTIASFTVVSLAVGQTSNIPAPAAPTTSQSSTPVATPSAGGSGAGGSAMVMPSASDDKAYLVARREYEKDIRKIWGRYLHDKTYEPTRAQGFAQLRAFTEPAAIEPLIEVLRDDKPDCRAFLLDHLQKDVAPQYGQATLAWLAVHDKDDSFRRDAIAHLAAPINPVTAYVIEAGLQSSNPEYVSGASVAAGALKMAQAIPLLITAQSPASQALGGQGDLAFIQLGRTQYYVSNLTPVVGYASAGFQPTLSPAFSGTIIRINDAVVEYYNADAHNSLVSITKHYYPDAPNFGFDSQKWNQWYGQTFLPYYRQKHSAPEGKSPNAVHPESDPNSAAPAGAPAPGLPKPTVPAGPHH